MAHSIDLRILVADRSQKNSSRTPKDCIHFKGLIMYQKNAGIVANLLPVITTLVKETITEALPVRGVALLAHVVSDGTHVVVGILKGIWSCVYTIHGGRSDRVSWV